MLLKSSAIHKLQATHDPVIALGYFLIVFKAHFANCIACSRNCRDNQFTMRQIFGDVRWEVKAVVFIGLIIVFTVVGPFGSYERYSFAQRFSYWTAIMVGVGFFMHIFISMALRAPALANWSALLRVVMGASAAAIPGAGIVEFVNQIYGSSAVALDQLITTWFQVSIVGIVVGAVEYIDWRPKTEEAPAIPMSPFHKRLDPELGTDIVSLSMQDHYVEVTTTLGTTVILMRFSDALDEIANLPGQRIHRSHWVALPHVTRLTKQGNRVHAILSDERQIPVSATYLKDIKMALE